METHTELTSQAASDLRITSGQRRTIAALLSRIADVIARFETLSGITLDERLSYAEHEAQFEEATKANLRQTAVALVREANALASLTGIVPSAKNVHSVLSAEFTLLWSDVEDTNAERLRGYGPLSQEASVALARHISSLARLSLSLAKAARLP